MNGGSGGAAAHSPHGSLCVALLSPVATARMRTNAGPDALANPPRVSADEGAMEGWKSKATRGSAPGMHRLSQVMALS